MPLRLMLAAALALAGGCATFSSDSSGRPADGAVSFGIVAYGGNRLGEADAKALESALTTRLGQPVSVRIYEDETAAAAGLGRGEVDAAWMPPLAFVGARAHGAVAPIVKALRHGIGHYRSVIFARADKGPITLDDLKGTTIAWVDRRSASGYVFALEMLERAGYKPQELFKQELFAGDHAAVCRAVLDGKADAGATFADDRPAGEQVQIDGCVQAVGVAEAAQLHIIRLSKPIPNDVIAVRPGCPRELAAALKNMFLLLSADAAGKAILSSVFKADAFVEANMAEFRFATDDG
jgi:phosphonate transport system substrate-binding protein